MAAARKIGLNTNSISVEKPAISSTDTPDKGSPIYKGSVKLRGRAVDKLIDGLPTRSWEAFTECPFEDLRNPGRVHLDSIGNVHLCQGLSMGNIWDTPLSELIDGYDPDAHPICGPILKGGPAELARTYDLRLDDKYVDACHLCSKTCKALIDDFPQYLTPRQVYGLDV